MAPARTLVVIPALDEVGTIGDVVAEVRNLGFDCVVIDDGSTDGTAAAANRVGAWTVTLPLNLGVGGAMRTGFRFAEERGYDRVIQVDGDGQHPPSAIPILLEAADAGFDLVIGSRFAEGYEASSHRRAAMRALAWLVSRRSGVHLDDVTSGFRVISEPLLSSFARSYPAEYLGDTVEAILQAAASGATITQVSVPMKTRASGSATSSVVATGHLARVGVSMLAGKPQRMSR